MDGLNLRLLGVQIVFCFLLYFALLGGEAGLGCRHRSKAFLVPAIVHACNQSAPRDSKQGWYSFGLDMLQSFCKICISIFLEVEPIFV